MDTDGPDGEVDEVVVDRAWAEEIKHSSITDSHSGDSPDKFGGSPMGGTNTDHESLAVHIEGFWAHSTLGIILRWRVWPAILGFFRLHFMDEKSEAHYRKENWFFRKGLAIWSAAFFIINWVLAAIFVQKPTVLADKIYYYGIAPVSSFPILFMVIYDFPRDRPWIYQSFLVLATWSWAIYQVLFMYLCGFYDDGNAHTYFVCGSKDFLSTFYYTSAMQTIALFGLNLNRFPALIGALTFFIVSCVLIIPDYVTWIRDVLNFLVFQAFLLYVHYMRENGERRLYTLRDQLKIQFKATQKAQINERKTADSKRRLTSYVFHEVRVPLNTALLAVQNMDAYGVVPKAQEIEFNALDGSLNMMSKVLNDVLDFHRMDSGRFESLNKPYAFHQVMRSLFVPLRLDTDSRQLEFVTELDRSIDDVAQRAYYSAMGKTEDQIANHMIESSEIDGIVVGDETRLRQIITNLAGNACKFTPAGGKITISTKLVVPTREEIEVNMPSNARLRRRPSSTSESQTHDVLSADHLSQHNGSGVKQLDWIVVRIEVTDTGYGIRQKDMIQSKLFTAFNQTEQGRQQGGKGTGLGLALVRQIVKLSGGRLGVKSKVGTGSTFWVELPLAVGKKALPPTPQPMRPSLDRLNSDNCPQAPPPTPDIEGRCSPPQRSPSSTILEHVMNPEGLVQLIPRKKSSVDRESLRTTGGDFGSVRVPFFSLDHRRNSSDSSLRPQMQAHEIHHIMSSSQAVRPQHLELPKPPQFNSDGTLQDESPVTSFSSTLPSGSPPGSIVPFAEFEPGLQVLVVDDDRMTRMLMERMLDRLKCVVSTAVNGQEALKLILGDAYTSQPPLSDDEHGTLEDSSFTDSRGPAEEGPSLQLQGNAVTEDTRFAIVFLDNQMPVMTGVQLVQMLRKMGRRDLVVGVTGNALLPDQEEYLEAGVDHVLTKPVREENVRAMLSIADEKRKSSRRPAPPMPETP